MTVVVGYDRHPASRTAVLFAGELAGALNVPIHVVHVVDVSDGAMSGSSGESAEMVQHKLHIERQHVGEALEAAHVRWEFHLLNGDPVRALLKTADDYAATLIVVGRPQRGIGPTLSHIVTGTVTRNLLRHTTRPVVVVPGFADSP